MIAPLLVALLCIVAITLVTTVCNKAMDEVGKRVQRDIAEYKRITEETSKTVNVDEE